MARIDALSSLSQLSLGLSPFRARAGERDGFPVLPGALPIVGHTLAAGLDESA